MILLPARNEGPRVGPIVAQLRVLLPDHAVVVVASDCTDDTEARAREAGAEVITGPAGYARALQCGYRHALERWGPGGGEWLVQLDADGQHPAAAVPELVAGLEEADVVIGSRFVGGRQAKWMPISRRVAIHGVAWWSRGLAGLDIHDVTSGFQALRPAVVASLAARFPQRVADANVLVRLKREGFRIREHAVEMAPRQGGTSMHGGLASVAYTAHLAWLVAREAGAR